jgi:hypothetical protein
VTERVVDFLEVVDIEEHQGRRQASASGLLGFLQQAVLEKHAVGQAGDVVVMGEILQQGCGLFLLGDVADKSAERGH